MTAESEEGRRGTNPDSQKDAGTSIPLICKDEYINVLYHLAIVESKFDTLERYLDRRIG
jgi:hypothetical protein